MKELKDWKRLFTIHFHIGLFQNAATGLYKVLGDKARLDSNQIVGDPFKLNKMLETGKYAYPFVSDKTMVDCLISWLMISPRSSIKT